VGVKKERLPSRDPSCVPEKVTETFTHRQTLDDGRVILADPAANFWRVGGSSWKGAPPLGWDPAKATTNLHIISYTHEADYS
jgi:hypothetical protein